MGRNRETLDFIRSLEVSANRKLSFPDAVAVLIENRSRWPAGRFDELIFLAKFLTKSFGVMQRIGRDGDGFDKLSFEFKSNLEKVFRLLQELQGETSGDSDSTALSRFVEESATGVDDLMLLLKDLTIVKNWTLDGKPLP